MKNDQTKANSKDYSSKENSSNKSQWKDSVIGGLSGIILGGSGVLFTGFTLPESQPEPTPNPEPNPETLTAAEVPLAHSVTDDMTFSEAFAAARMEVGAGGVFIWHGSPYGTYYASEWNSMTEAEHQSYAMGASQTYLASINDTAHQPTPAPQPAPTPEPTPTPQPAPEPEPTHNIEVVEVSQNVILDNGVTVDVAIAEVDGTPIAYIDVDQDGIIDMAMADVNGDGSIDDNEIVLLEPQDGLTMDTFMQLADSNGEDTMLYADMPDYTNDADVSSLV